MLDQLRKPRYLALGAVMALVAILCVIAGTWQIERFIEKHDDNRTLRHNAHTAVTAVADVMTTTDRPAPGRTGVAVQFRRVTATGTYDTAGQLVVREQTVDGVVGFLVLTPLRTTTGPVLLVVRGFVAANGNNPTTVAAPPTGSVTVTARVEPAPGRSDDYGKAPAGQVTSIDADAAARRLGVPVYDGYAELLDKQPGTARLTVIPAPDLSNPAGGAVEPQHLAYIVQWYLFALLALAAPLIMARAEARGPEPDDADEDLAGLAEDDQSDTEASPDPDEQARRARLADRYGRAG